MGWNDHMPEEGEFTAVAIEAGAVTVCPIHAGVTINRCNSKANSRAYAIATNRWKEGTLLGDREDIMEGVKDAIEQSAEECPVCEGLRDA